MIRIAVIGPGNISHRFMEGMKHVSGARVTAFVSRHPDAVREYAQQYGVEQIGTTEDILLKSGIDAAYISTPNHVHYSQIRFCLERGIHVLCEKPITVTAREYRDLLSLAHSRNLVLMEAQKALYTPVFTAMKQALEAGEIGRITDAEAGFCRNEGLPDDAWRLNAPGNGALYDVGCYPLSVLFGLFGCGLKETGRSESFYKGSDVSGVLRLTDGTIPFTVRYSMIQEGLCGLRITGTKGSLSCPDFWKASSFEITKDGTSETRSFPFESEFTCETQYFVQRIVEGRVMDEAHEAISTSVLEILQR